MLNIKILEEEIEKLGPEFEDMINCIFKLKYPESHSHDSVANKDSGLDGSCKNKTYMLACYSPKNRKKINTKKIELDIYKHIKLNYEEGYKKSIFYIKTKELGMTHSNNVFKDYISEGKINIDNFIKKTYKKMKKEINKISYLKEFYDDEKLKEELANYDFEYKFLEDITQEIQDLFDTVENKNKVFEQLKKYLPMEKIYIINENIKFRKEVGNSHREPEKEYKRLENKECEYSSFLKDNFEIKDMLEKIHTFLLLDNLQEKYGDYLGYEDEIKKNVQMIKKFNKFYMNDYDKREKYINIYDEQEHNIKIDKEINNKIHQGICGHIGSSLTVLSKKEGKVDWNE